MRQTQAPKPQRLFAGIAGLVLLAWAADAAEFAARHMSALGVICGAEAPHCGWCYVAAALGLAGLAALGFAARPAPLQRIRVRAR